MLAATTVAMMALTAVVGVVCAGIVAARLLRTRSARRRAALAAGPRRVLLAFVADNGEHGAEGLVALPDTAWRAIEPAALALLGKLRGEAHQALVGVFMRRGVAHTALHHLRSRSRVRRARAAQVLGDLEVRAAVPELCRLLSDRHDEVRVVAVRALGRIGDPAAAWRLIACLDRPDPVPSLLVSHTLVQLGAEAEVTLSAALDHPQPGVRVVCLDALGLLGATTAVARMARVLRADPSLDVRVAAATNLGRVGARSALDPLIEALGTAHPVALRSAAARALGRLGSRAAVPHLADLLPDRSFRVAHDAAHALRHLGHDGLEALHEALDADPEAGSAGPVPSAAAHALEALGAAALAARPTPDGSRAPDAVVTG